MMLWATLFSAFYGSANGYGPGPGPAPSPDMCCTANVAMSSSYSVCEDVMNRFSNPSDQEDACLNGRFTGQTNGVSTCKWTQCSDVGYCVDSRDADYFDEMSAWEANEHQQRSLLSIDRDELNAAWGNSKPTNPPKTPRPTNPPKTPRPTSWTAPKTPKPTNPPKTPKPTNTPKPTPNRVKTPKPTNPPKTPKPT